MSLERTEVTWSYEPAEFFEAAFAHNDPDFELLIEGGSVVATLRNPQDPIDAGLLSRIEELVSNIFLVRQLEVHRQVTLGGESIRQHSPRAQTVSVAHGLTAVIAFEAHADGQVVDADGRVVFDSRAQRISEDSALIEAVAPGLSQSPVLRAMFVSYSSSISDSSNELVHLYEVRDALVRHYGSAGDARQALSITKTDWSRFGRLSNEDPLKQGRHRGRHGGAMRDATYDELEDARRLAKTWILAFAATI